MDSELGVAFIQFLVISNYAVLSLSRLFVPYVKM